MIKDIDDIKEFKIMGEEVKTEDLILYDILGFDREVYERFLKKYNNKYGQKNSNHFKNK